MVVEDASRRAARRGSGSPSALRRANTERLVAVLRYRGPSTQASLARATGLSPATVSNLVRMLAEDGQVVTGTTTANGRRAVEVSLAEQHRSVAAGIDVGRRHVRLLLVAEDGEVLAESFEGLPVGHSLQACFALVEELLDRALAEVSLERADLVGAGVGIPGPIDARTGLVGHAALLPEWVGLHVRQALEDHLQLPVTVDNDANLGALAEARWGAHAGVPDLAYVKVASGIGAGLILGGQLHRGHIGITGEIGHLQVSSFGQVCRCGNRGCLETVAAVPTLLAGLEASVGRTPRTSELLQLVQSGDLAALRVLEDAGLVLGQVLGGLCNLLNPAVIVLGGPLMPVGDLLLAAVRRGLERATTPVVAAATTVTLESFGARAEALGAAAVAHAAERVRR
ncbi:ROK family protein [Arsenicicoccus sp. MKL-02]|uniref:ROK family protein n=1 Tax=Arsenicicoccus cauae TaxID=2663847 RepID=A0A6I3ID32_9MICO|nr:ROK family transcriptional regulator [Arsenicicoccus cauae]MTB72118.1 ROK family protein [Arsenicicoccus cauae]